MLCDNCGKKIHRANAFTMRVDLFATPERDSDGAVVIEESNLDLLDYIAQMQEMTSIMTRHELLELEDEVAESYQFQLCRKCRGEFHLQLKRKMQQKKWRNV